MNHTLFWQDVQLQHARKKEEEGGIMEKDAGEESPFRGLNTLIYYTLSTFLIENCFSLNL